MNRKTSRKPLVIAHRGDTKQCVENTLPAIESAIRLGVDGIEVDLRKTADGVLVLFHDKDLRRLAGSDLEIEKTEFSSLRKVKLGDTFIPTLEELLDLAGDKVLLNLEIKTTSLLKGESERRLVAALDSFSLDDSILVSSFYPQSLRRMKRLAPRIKRGYLFKKRPFLHKMIVPFVSPFSLNLPLPCATKTTIDAAHKAGKKVFVWTVNDGNDMKRCSGSGADGIITDESRKLLMLLQGLSR